MKHCANRDHAPWAAVVRLLETLIDGQHVGNAPGLPSCNRLLVMREYFVQPGILQAEIQAAHRSSKARNLQCPSSASAPALRAPPTLNAWQRVASGKSKGRES